MNLIATIVLQYHEEAPPYRRKSLSEQSAAVGQLLLPLLLSLSLFLCYTPSSSPSFSSFSSSFLRQHLSVYHYLKRAEMLFLLCRL